jgi:hypothetical protein
VITLAMLGACATLTPAGEKVQVVQNPNAVKDCQSLGPVEATSLWGGVIGVHAGYESNLRALRTATAERQGNTLLVLGERAGIVTSSKGEAYRCQP